MLDISTMMPPAPRVRDFADGTAGLVMMTQTVPGRRDASRTSSPPGSFVVMVAGLGALGAGVSYATRGSLARGALAAIAGGVAAEKVTGGNVAVSLGAAIGLAYVVGRRR